MWLLVERLSILPLVVMGSKALVGIGLVEWDKPEGDNGGCVDGFQHWQLWSAC